MFKSTYHLDCVLGSVWILWLLPEEYIKPRTEDLKLLWVFSLAELIYDAFYLNINLYHMTCLLFCTAGNLMDN